MNILLSYPNVLSLSSCHSVEKFATEMDTLLEITLRSSLVEKLSMALYDCLFELEEEEDREAEGKFDGFAQSSLEEFDHIAVASVHAFLQVQCVCACVHDCIECVSVL